jgi:hypothetical protein
LYVYPHAYIGCLPPQMHVADMSFYLLSAPTLYVFPCPHCMFPPSPNVCRRPVVLPTVCPSHCMSTSYIYCMFPSPNACLRRVVLPTVCPSHCMSTPIHILYVSLSKRMSQTCCCTYCLPPHCMSTSTYIVCLYLHDCNTTCRGVCKHLHYVMHVFGSSMLCGVVGMSCWDRHTCYNQHVCLYMYMHVNNTTCRVGSNTTCHNQHVGVFVHACQQHDMSCWVQDRMPTTRHVVLGTDVL